VVRVPEPIANAVSCVARTFCVAGGGNGDLMTWNGSAWSTGEPQVLADDQGWESVSCASRTLCVALTPVQTSFGTA
jgi:hypothetical protein